MLNLDGQTGTVGTSSEAAWISQGFDQYLGLGKYKSDPGAKFSGQPVQSALNSRLNTVLLFPVFKTLTGTGQNAQFRLPQTSDAPNCGAALAAADAAAA